MTRKTSTIATFAATLILVASLAGIASACASFPAGETASLAPSGATVQLAGWTGRARAVIKRTLQRRLKIRTPNTVTGVRG